MEAPRFSLNRRITSTEILKYGFFVDRICYFLNLFLENNDAASKDCFANHVVADAFNLSTALEIAGVPRKRLSFVSVVEAGNRFELTLIIYLYGRSLLTFELREQNLDTSTLSHQFQRWSATGGSPPSFMLYELFINAKQSAPWTGGTPIFATEETTPLYASLKPLNAEFYHEDIKMGYPGPLQITDPRNHRHRIHGVNGKTWSWGTFKGLTGAPFLQIPFDDMFFKKRVSAPLVLKSSEGNLNCFDKFSDMSVLLASLDVPLNSFVPKEESILFPGTDPEDVEMVSDTMNAIMCLLDRTCQVTPAVLSQLKFHFTVVIHTEDAAFAMLDRQDEGEIPRYKLGNSLPEHHLFYKGNSYYAMKKFFIDSDFEASIRVPSKHGYFFDALQQAMQQSDIEGFEDKLRLQAILDTAEELKRGINIDSIPLTEYGIIEATGTFEEKLRKAFQRLQMKRTSAYQIKQKLKKNTLAATLIQVESFLPVRLDLFDEATAKMTYSKADKAIRKRIIVVRRSDNTLSVGRKEKAPTTVTPSFLLTHKNNLYLLQLSGKREKRFMYTPLLSTDGVSLRYTENEIFNTNSNIMWCGSAALYELFISGSDRSKRTMRLPSDALSGEQDPGREPFPFHRFYAAGVTYTVNNVPVGMITNVDEEKKTFTHSFDSLYFF